MDAVIALNKEVEKKIEGGIIKYLVDIQYVDGSTSTEFLNVNIGERPKIPDEPEDNIAFGPGNRAIKPEFLEEVPVDAFSSITDQVKKTDPVLTSVLRGKLNL